MIERKHIYLHTSNVENTSRLRNEELFEPVFKYCPITEIPYIHQNEYGRIKTKDAYYHILVGQIRKKGCLWCNFPLNVISEHIKDEYPNDANKFKLFCECQRCGARGPSKILFINFDDQKVKDCIDQLILQHYQEIPSWEESIGLKREVE